MKQRNISILAVKFFLLLFLTSCSVSGRKSIAILETTDIHGVILPYDYIENRSLDASLASCFTYIKKVREEKDAVVLLDNGDNLQGQPEVYYYNFIDTISPHLISEAMNYMSYDAGSVGNHDIEAGHSVYDRLVKDYKFPLLAANAVDVKTGKPYFKPYTIIVKDGIKVAVLGMVTPAIPNWLPEELFRGIEFIDMVATAKKWMPVIIDENPDIIVGLFHSGWDSSEENLKNDGPYHENGSAAVAYNVPGFDVIFNGHDHRVANEKFVNMAGDTVLILNGGSHAGKIAQANISITKGQKGKNQIRLKGSIINVADYKPDPEYVSEFNQEHATIDNYVKRVIGNATADISSREAYFGPSAFIDLIHSIQLEITGADISFAAPLSFDVKIPEGPVTVGDMFKLYRFENMLYTMSLNSDEIKKYLEYSYGEWLNTMSRPGDQLLKLRTGKDGKPAMNNGKVWLRNQPYNFDSASGIDYTVDVSKPEGSRITIIGFSDGRPFEKGKIYKIAVNSYRGNGGGGHLIEGAGIKKEELMSRIISSTDKDLRYYILKSIEFKKVIDPKAAVNWKIIPENWVKEAAVRDYSLLFGPGK